VSDLADQLVEEEEGPPQLTAYRDSLGEWTIGRGHLLPDQAHDYTGFTWTPTQCAAQQAHDMGVARALAPRYPGFEHVDFENVTSPRAAVIVSMAFQLYAKPLKWPVFMAALTARDYTAAAAAGRDSQWCKVQTPKRANREMEMLESDLWVPHA
jgi:GH24 family phage-related lysozyme (muramidase)